MIRKSKWVALLLVLSLVLTMLPTTSKADTTGGINAWFSNDATGGLYLYAHPSQTVTLNYRYSGSFSTFKTKISVIDEGGTTVLSEVYTNTPQNQISVPLSENEGTYTAIVTVTSGMNSVTDRAEISVIAGIPRIEKQPENVITEVQQDAVFQVSSQDPATYQWFRTKTLDEEGEEISGAASSILTITGQNVVASANGDYFYCIVTANGKSITSNYARLIIKGIPVPTESPRNTPESTPELTPEPTPEATPDDTAAPDANPTNTPQNTSTPSLSPTPAPEETPANTPEITMGPSPSVSEVPTIVPTQNPSTNPPLPSETPKQNEVKKDGAWILIEDIVKLNEVYSGTLKDGTDRTVVENKDKEIGYPAGTLVFETADGSIFFAKRPSNADIKNSIWVAQKGDYFAIYPTNTPEVSKVPIPTLTSPTKTSVPNNVIQNNTPAGTPKVDTAIAPIVRYDSFSISGKYNGAKNRVEFTWDKLDASLSFISISRSTKKDGVYEVLGAPTKTSYYDTTVFPNRVYYYKVSYLKNDNNIYTYYLSNICSIKTTPNPTVKGFKASKKGRKLILNWKYGMYANRVAVYVKTGKKWTKAGTTIKSTCKMTIPPSYKKVKARIRPYNVIKGKKYYGRYSKTRTVSFKKKKR